MLPVRRLPDDHAEDTGRRARETAQPPTLGLLAGLGALCAPFLVVGLMGLAACGGCTDVGCTPGVTVDLRRIDDRFGQASRIEVCAGQQCEILNRQRDYVELGAAQAAVQRTLPVSVKVFSKSKRLAGPEYSATLERFQPNGDGCEPVCYTEFLRARVVGGAIELRPPIRE